MDTQAPYVAGLVGHRLPLPSFGHCAVRRALCATPLLLPLLLIVMLLGGAMGLLLCIGRPMLAEGPATVPTARWFGNPFIAAQ